MSTSTASHAVWPGISHFNHIRLEVLSDSHDRHEVSCVYFVEVHKSITTHIQGRSNAVSTIERSDVAVYLSEFPFKILYNQLTSSLSQQQIRRRHRFPIAIWHALANLCEITGPRGVMPGQVSSPCNHIAFNQASFSHITVAENGGREEMLTTVLSSCCNAGHDLH